MIEMMYPVISLSYPLQTNLCQPCSHLILIQYCLENLEIKTSCYPILTVLLYLYISIIKMAGSPGGLKWFLLEVEDIFFLQSVGVRDRPCHISVFALSGARSLVKSEVRPFYCLTDDEF